MDTNPPAIYICAIWLTKSKRADNESIRFWSQVLNCPASFLKGLIVQCIVLEAPERQKQMNPSMMQNVKDDLLKLIWYEIKDYTIVECKSILDASRRENNE